MKTRILTLVAMVVGGAAIARTPIPSVLEYTDVPTGHGMKVTDFRSVRVYVNGSVVASVRNAGGSRIVKVSQLDSEKMDGIFELIKAARDGEVLTVIPGVKCIIASPILHTYTAEMGRVTLYHGHPCNGRLLVNQAPEAGSLRRILDSLVSEAFDRPRRPSEDMLALDGELAVR